MTVRTLVNAGAWPACWPAGGGGQGAGAEPDLFLIPLVGGQSVIIGESVTDQRDCVQNAGKVCSALFPRVRQ